MGLRKLTFNEKRGQVLHSSQRILNNFSFPESADTINGYISRNAKIGYFYESSIDKCVEQFYGKPDDDDFQSSEWILANILFRISILKKIDSSVVWGGYHQRLETEKNNDYRELLLGNVKRNITLAFPDYEIHWAVKSDFINFEPKETKSVTENLGNLPEVVADPIKQLLMPMKTKQELIGLISEVYKNIEKIPKVNKGHLNETDKLILNKTQEFTKLLANKVDGAKGHTSDSKLSIKDIAHNFALNASLIHKLLIK